MQDSTHVPKQGHAPHTLTFVRLTNAHGPLTKTFSVNRDDPNGKPVGSTAAKLAEGRADLVQCADIAEFMAERDRAEPDQAFAYGVIGRDSADVVTKEQLRSRSGAIARSREFFHFRSAPGIWMLDHDAGYLPTAYDDAESLRQALFSAVPALRISPMGWAPSASSYIFNENTGVQVRGPGGARLYLPVTNASDAPRAMKALREYLWAAGIGAYTVSKAGRLLERTLFDLSTVQPERLDFVGGAKCEPPLVQRSPASRVFEDEIMGGLDPIDLQQIIPDPSPDVRQRAEDARAAARAARESDRLAQRVRYKSERVDELVARGIGEKAALEVVDAALDKSQLFADFVLYPEGGEPVTVGQVLDDPKRWHTARFADPLEPDYGNDGRIAFANLRGGGRPYIYSHAHGGQRYTLFRQPTRLEIAGGDDPRLADQCVDLMRVQHLVFDGPSDGMLRVDDDGRIRQVTAPWLQDHLGRIASFQRFDRRKNDFFPASPPPTVVNAILAREGQRELPKLNAVVTAPTMRANGTVLDVPGYDATSGVLYLTHTLDVPQVTQAPKFPEVMEALRELFQPIEQFPYDGPQSRAVALAAMLTSCIRPALPTAPAFAIDAPAAGTGKTLLARCIALIGGHNTDTAPFPASEEERRKLIFALLRGGQGCMTFDNVAGVLCGEAFDQAMTSAMYSSRVLGESRSESVPNRAMVLITGNNLQTRGDTHRRVLRCRINANAERPYLRTFEFNPAQVIEANRLRLVAAALTVIRGYLVDEPRKGCLASFEDWDRLVRNAILWLARQQTEIELADPVDTITAAEDGDDTRSAVATFLQEWWHRYGDSPVAASSIVGTATDDFDDAGKPARSDDQRAADAKLRALMRAAVRGTDSRRTGDVTARELGDWLSAHKDLIVGGLKLERAANSRTNVAQWIVTAFSDEAAG